MGTDKNRIWDDCAECAYKHLTAAYAALTAEPWVGKQPIFVAAGSEIQLARSIIASRETGAGYIGNRHLAYGCLAFSEQTGPVEMIPSLRECRRASGGLSEYKAGFNSVTWVAANILEAFRELPELSDKLTQDPEVWVFDGSGLGIMNPEALCTKLNDAIVWLYDTFELGGRTNE